MGQKALSPVKPSSHRSRKDESNNAGGAVVDGVSSSSFFSSSPSFNSLPMDVLVLIFEYIPQYARLMVVKFVSKRFHSAVLRSFKTISSRDFRWNWKFVFEHFRSITSLDISNVKRSDLPDVLPPRLSTLTFEHVYGHCTCNRIEKTSSLTSLSVTINYKCPPLDRLVSNSLSSLTFLELSGFVPPPSTLYLPSLRQLVVHLDEEIEAKPFIIKHASQLTRLECGVSCIQDIRFPLLRHLDVTITSEDDDASFLQNCPSLTHLDATLQDAGIVELTRLATTITGRQEPVLASLYTATRLTAIDSTLFSNEYTMQCLLPVASRLKRLGLRGKKKKQDCAAILALCPMLEELKLSHLYIASNASLSLPHLVKLEVLFEECSLGLLSKFLIVAPRLSLLQLFLRDPNSISKSDLKSFLQAAERAGVERILLCVLPSHRDHWFKFYSDLNFKWLHTSVILSSDLE